MAVMVPELALGDDLGAEVAPAPEMTWIMDTTRQQERVVVVQSNKSVFFLTIPRSHLGIKFAWKKKKG